MQRPPSSCPRVDQSGPWRELEKKVKESRNFIHVGTIQKASEVRIFQKSESELVLERWVRKEIGRGTSLVAQWLRLAPSKKKKKKKTSPSSAGFAGLIPGWKAKIPHALSSVQFSCSAVSDSLRPHELQHARPPCPTPTPRAYPNSCPLSQWCHPTTSSSVVPFSSCP